MNIYKRCKIVKNLIKIAEVIYKVWSSKQEKIKDALWFFESYVPEAKPYIDNLRNILKKG